MEFTRRQWILCIVLAGAVACAWLRPLDDSAARQVDAGLKRALVSFASARALNAVISVVQGTEISIQIAGFGPNFTPGQALDPVNDLVEQFSTLMLYASVSFGIQALLIKVGGWWGVSLALTAAAAAWTWHAWRPLPAGRWIARVLAVLLLARFAVPLAVVGSEAAFQFVLAERYQADQARIDASLAKLTRLALPMNEPRPGEGVAERFKRWLAQGSDVAAEVSRRIDELKTLAGDLVEHVVMLVAVFLLQTLVLPLLFLLLLARAARAALELRPGESLQKAMHGGD